MNTKIDWSKPIEIVTNNETYPARLICSNRVTSGTYKFIVLYLEKDGNENIVYCDEYGNRSISVHLIRNVPPKKVKEYIIICQHHVIDTELYDTKEEAEKFTNLPNEFVAQVEFDE